MIEEKWQKMTIFQQLGNIASEISRAIGWEKKGDIEAKKNALERALELINLTLENKNLGSGLKEVARLQEFVADNYANNQSYKVDLSSLYDYLLPFAVASRNL